MMFAIVCEGRTDYPVLKNLLIGFFNNKNLHVTRWLPKDKEPVGWGNVHKYLSSTEFRDGVDIADYIVVQIDTKECEDWGEGLKQMGDDVSKVEAFVDDIKKVLIRKIGLDFYSENANKILFAITVHDIECWLLPFNSTTKAHQSKMVGCVSTLEHIAQKKGFSINQKNYEDGKHYEDFSKEMKNRKELMKKQVLNPSLKIFIDTLSASFSSEVI